VTAVRPIRNNKKENRRGAECERGPILTNNPPKVICAHADYRREDYMFQRTQSLTMRALEWEGRLKPMRPWAPNFVANLAFGIFA
jgi:hypothetical protein